MPLNCGAGEDSWVPWTARSNQSILREINPKYSLEGLTLKLKLQYLGHLMQIAGSLEKSLMLGKIEGRRRRGHQSMRWLDGITDAMDMHLGKLCEMVKDREAWHIAVYGAAKGWTGLGNWTARNKEVKTENGLSKVSHHFFFSQPLLPSIDFCYALIYLWGEPDQSWVTASVEKGNSKVMRQGRN